MFKELERVMDFSIESGNFLESIQNNVYGKKSADGIKQTGNFLKRIYSFESDYLPFSAFKYFWKITEEKDKPLLTLIYAINHDYLLAESIEVINNSKPGDKVTLELFEENIESNYPNYYGKITKRSIAKNLASSWKQAGFIDGRVKNIRVEPDIDIYPTCFAFLLAYLKGDRGDYVWNSISVKALCLSEGQLRILAVECAKRDLMQYQYAGGVTLINFDNLLNKIGIDGF